MQVVLTFLSSPVIAWRHGKSNSLSRVLSSEKEADALSFSFSVGCNREIVVVKTREYKMGETREIEMFSVSSQPSGREDFSTPTLLPLISPILFDENPSESVANL